MLNRLITILVFLFASLNVFAQQFSVRGQIVDAQSGEPLAGANVMIRQPQAGFQSGQSSGPNGDFEFKEIPAGNYALVISFVGYDNHFSRISITNRSLVLDPIKLTLKDQNLNEVRVSGTLVRQEQRGDTTVYNADAFKVNPDATTEDLLNKMPGITVEGSTVKAGGEQVRKVLVDGKEFFGNDPMLALRNLQADMVERIEVYDRQSDQAQFTGFNDGSEERTINIATRRGVANGSFGRFYAGYGTDSRYEAGGNYNYFKGTRRISVLGLFNNINQQNFSMEDITGAVGGQVQRRMGGGGPGGGMMGESLGGITKTNSFGVNYSDNWGKKIEVTSSYFFNNTGNENNSNVFREYFATSDGVRIYDEIYRSESTNYNHRFNMRMVYTIDSLNSIIFTPRVSWQNNESNSLTSGIDYINAIESLRTTGAYNSESQGYSINGEVMYRHKFNKDRRTISLRVGTSSFFTNGESNSYSLREYLNQQNDNLFTNQFTTNDNNNYSINTDLVYTEPISPKSMIMLNYSPSITKSEGDKEVFDRTLDGAAAQEPIALLSNKTTSDYLQQRGGVGYNYTNEGFNLVAVVNYQFSDLEGKQVYPQYSLTEKSFNSVLPSVIVRYRKDRSTNLRMMYRTNTNAPSINQLQNVVDNSNTRIYSSGNPGLKQQYSHNLMFFYNKNNIQTSRSFFAMGGFTATNDYVATSSVIASQDSIVGNGVVLPRGTQFNKPVNLSGLYSLRSFVTYAFPVTAIKSNINFNAGVNFQSRPGMYNYKKNKSNTYALTAGVVVGSSISPELDFTLSYNGGYNIIESTSALSQDYNYFNHSTQFEFNWIFLKRMVFNNSLRHLYYTGLGEGYDQNFLLWNAGLGVKFLKENRGELRLKVYDLLDQNKSVSRSIREAYVETTNTNVLTRYAMLTFTYRLKSNGNRPTQNQQIPFGPGGGHIRFREGGEGTPPPPPGAF